MRGDLHIGGVMIQLVDSLGEHIDQINNWSFVFNLEPFCILVVYYQS